MSVPTLAHRHIFGLKANVNDNVHFVDNNIILYPAGHNVIMYNTETKMQRFIHGSQNAEGPAHKIEITALAVSPNKRFVALAEKGEERAIITIYDVRTLKKRKKLRQPSGIATGVSAAGGDDALGASALRSHEYVSLSFSMDGRSLLSQGGAPDNILVNWLWEKAKPLHITKVQVNGEAGAGSGGTGVNALRDCSFAPSPSADAGLVCVTGQRTLAFLRIDPQSPATHMHAIALDPKALVTTTSTPKPAAARGDDDDLQLSMERPDADGDEGEARADDDAEGSEVPHQFTSHCWLSGKKCLVGTAQGDLLLFDNAVSRGTIATAPLNGAAVTYIAPTASGFVCGLDDGVVYVYETHATQHYKRVRTFVVPENAGGAVTGMAVSPNDEGLVVSLSTQQLWMMSMFATDTLRTDDMQFQRVSTSFHTGKITGLDICVRKPIAVTCGADRTVRVWNYEDKTVELNKLYREQPLSVALDPSGLQLLIGFADKLRLCTVLMDDLRTVKEYPIKGSREVHFSNGGQMFAAVNGSLVQVYSTYTGEPVTTLRGHTGRIASIYWSLDDTSIVSAGDDGAVYERKLNQTARTQEYVQKGCKFTSALSTDDGKLYAVGDDRVLKEVTERSVSKAMDFRVALTVLAVAHPPQRMLFAATQHGLLRAFQFPLTGDFRDYRAHSATVTRLRVSIDDRLLFSVGDDGCLCIFSVQEPEARVGKGRDRPDTIVYSDEVLVTKADLEEKQMMMSELKGKVDELTANNEYQLRLHDMNYQEKLKEVSEKYNLQIENDRSQIAILQEATQNQQLEYDEKTRAILAAHAQQLHTADLRHQKSIMKEVDLYQELLQRQAAEEKQYNEMIQDRHILAQQELAKLREKYEVELRREKVHCQAVQESKDVISREYEETVTQVEDDTDREIQQLRSKYDAQLHTERDATLRLKGENAIMKKKFAALQHDLSDQRDNIKQMTEKEEELHDRISLLEGKIRNHKDEIHQRDATIGRKEKSIYDLKRANQELEKYKFVLDYQIKELKRQIEPREKEIAEMKETVMRMDGQLESFHKDNGQLRDEVHALDDQLHAKQEEIHRQRQRLRRSVGELGTLRNDVHEVIQHIQDPARLKAGVRALYIDHVNELIRSAEVDTDVVAEYVRQRRFLERSVFLLKRKLKRDSHVRKNDSMRVMQENVSLIKEINNLRGEIKLITQVQKAKELNKAQSQNRRTGRACDGADASGSLGGGAGGPAEQDDFDEAEIEKIIALQRHQITTLRLEIEQAQARMAHARS